LLGPPGIGKTRLARELGLACLGDSSPPSGGVWFCNLADALDQPGACATVARSLGAPLVPSRDRADDDATRLGRAIERLGPCLILLDNFEQLAACAGSTVGRWLELAGRARFLVTSRERLHLAAEVCVEIGPLSLPDARDEAASSDAVALFLDRAQRIGSSSAVRPDEVPAVVEIVRRLDGIPLAIELAAARLDVLRPGDLVGRLDQRFELLRVGPRDAHTRQATLRDAVEWSWNLLPAVEQAALAQCSVFRGGFDLATAEAVLDLDAHPGPRSIVDVLQALRSKSLLRGDEPNPLGAPRFGMYETLREFAAERLQRPQPIEHRHAAFFLRLGEELARDIERGGGGGGQLDRLLLEQDNLLAVVRRMLAAQPRTAATVEAALCALLALDPVLSTRGPFDLYVELLDAVLDAARHLSIDRRHLVRALRARGEAKRTLGRLQESASDAGRALAESRAIGDPVLEGSSLHDLAVLARQRGEAETGALYEAALERLSRAEPHLLASVLDDFAIYLRQRGEAARALRLHERALVLLRRRGDSRSIGIVLGNIGILHHQMGLLETARSHYEHAVLLVRAAGDHRHEGLFLGRIGVLAQERGRWEEAAIHYERALVRYRAACDRRFEGLFLAHVGHLRREQHRHGEAMACYERARSLLQDAGDRRTEGWVIASLAGLCAAANRPEEAQRLFDAAEHVLRGSWDPGPLVALEIERLHLELGRARRAAHAGEMDQAVSLLDEAELHLRASLPATAVATESDVLPARVADEIRLALRIVAREFEAVRRAIEEPEIGASDRALLIGPDGRWFQVPGMPRVDLSRRRASRLLVRRLAEQRVAAPGIAVSQQALFATGWPGQKIRPDSASLRVRVALAELRKLGLRHILLSRDDGYLLDPAMRVIAARRVDRS
jgi:predicted ATPase